MPLRTLLLFAAALLLGPGCEREDAVTGNPDIAAAASGNAAVLLENDTTRVLRVTLPAGAGIDTHRGRPHLVYPLTDYRMNRVIGDLHREKKWRRGEIHWHDAGPHAVRNIGETPADFLVVERRVA